MDSHIVGVGKSIFGRNGDPTVVLASGHFYNWLEVAANYYTSQLAVTSMKNQSYCECVYVCMYLITGIFGGVNVWRIAKLKVIGKIIFGKWIDFGYKDTIYKLTVNVWQITDDSPNSPNFPTAKHSCYTAYLCMCVYT